MIKPNIAKNWRKLQRRYCIHYQILSRKPLCEDTYLTILYIGSRDRPCGDRSIIEFGRLEQLIPPPKFLKIFRSILKPLSLDMHSMTQRFRLSQILGLKIFLIDSQGIERWAKKISKIKTYSELLDFIEKTRVKNFHSLIVNDSNQNQINHNLTGVFYGCGMFLCRQDSTTTLLYISEIRTAIINFVKCNSILQILDSATDIKQKGVAAYKNLAECNRLLQSKKKLIASSIEVVNIKRDLILIEDYIEGGTRERLPERVKNALNEIRPDAFEDFITTLYRDLCKDMLKRKNFFKVCKYKECKRIFQRTFPLGKWELQWKKKKWCCPEHKKRAADKKPSKKQNTTDNISANEKSNVVNI